MDLGFKVFTRHFKSGQESPFRVSDSGEVTWRPTDSVRVHDALAEARRVGGHTIAYVWISADSALASRHPDWVCRGPDGKRPQEQRTRGTFLDLTSAYREVVLAELRALAAQGADGFFFDATHFPPTGCWGSSLQRAFERDTGQPVPTAVRPRDPRYLAFMAYQASRLQQTLEYWREAVHRDYPGVVFVVSVATLPTLMDPRYPTGLAESGDVPKTELEAPVRPALGGWRPGRDDVSRDVQIGAGWDLVRDAAGGRPPVVWSPPFADSAQALGFVAAVVTHGGIASLDVANAVVAGRDDASDATPVAALRAVASLGDRLAGALVGTRPVAEVGVHFPERARDALMQNPDRAYRETVLPALRAYETLLRARAPVRWVTDDALAAGELDELKLLVLPDPSSLTAAQDSAVGRFRSGGGTVVGPQGDSVAAAAAPLASVVAGGPTTLHVGYLRAPGSEETTILLTPDFSWVEPTARRGRAPTSGPPRAVTGVVLHLRGEPPAGGVRELVTGQEVEIVRTAGGYELRLPPFRFLAGVVVGGF